MRYRPDDSIAADMLKGAIAGAVATWVMDRVDWAMYRREKRRVASADLGGAP